MTKFKNRIFLNGLNEIVIMTDNMKRMELKDFFIDSLEDIFDAERKFMKCFTALGIAAVNETLIDVFTIHVAAAEQHVLNLERMLDALGSNAKDGGRCWMVNGLTDKAAETIRSIETGTALRDAAILCLAQVIQHYKIACYGNLTGLAKEMKHREFAGVIEKYWKEEHELSERLSTIARELVNPAAAAGYVRS